MLDKNNMPLLAMAGKNEICMRPEMINRHGLVTGATGTGKTVTLQSMAETFSAMGVPVFMADVKGDLSGIAEAGTLAGKPGDRVRQLGLEALGYRSQGFPVCFWDIAGRHGHPLRATISDAGPILLGRLLGLNDVQSGILQIIFRIADDNGLLLLDLKDLRSMAQYVSDNRDEFKTAYGQIAPASVGAIQRALLALEEEGGDSFFGEPALDVADLFKVVDGKGVVNILDAKDLVNSPRLYSCALLWLLSELFERLPEIGDQPVPKFVFFFDEAHLLFDGISSALLQKIEQVARLVRSRGVGVYFVSQNPSDIPDSVLGQLGNRVQHALRAFTPKDRKAVRAAAQAFRPNPAFSTEEVIGELGVGEALVSFLDENGSPRVVERCLMAPPQSRIGALSESERGAVMAASPLGAIYDKPLDRESAYEILTARAAWMESASQVEADAKAEARTRKAAEAEARRQEQERKREERRLSREGEGGDPLGTVLGSVVRQATRSAGSTLAREIGKSVFGSGVGGKIGTSIVRGILGGLLGGKR